MENNSDEERKNYFFSIQKWSCILVIKSKAVELKDEREKRLLF